MRLIPDTGSGIGHHWRLITQARIASLFLALTVISGFLSGILTLIQAVYLSKIIAAVFPGGQEFKDVTSGLWMLLVIIGLRSGNILVGDICATSVAVKVKHGLRQLLVQKIFALGPSYLRKERAGELTSVVVQGIEALDAYYSQYLPQLLLAVMLPTCFLIVIFPFDWLSGLVLLLTAPLIPMFMILIGKKSEARTRKQWTTLSSMSAHFLDTLQGLATLKALGQSKVQEGRISRISEQYRKATMGVLRITFLSAMVLELVGALSTAVIAVEIGLRLLRGSLNFETAFFILVITPEFYLPLRQLGLRFHAGSVGISAAKRIFEILDTPEEEIIDPDPGIPSGKVLSLEETFILTFEGVKYSYPGRAQPALNGVTFQIKSGTFTTLVGPSGGGKTSIAQMLLRFIQPQGGTIRINGEPIAAISLDQWKEQTAWVPQHPFLFHTTLLENIRLGLPEAAVEKVRRAAQLADLDEWICSLPKGYDTQVGEGGYRLSSGQAQRVALARAFLKDAPVLILDEPTAHLDPQLEKALDEIIYQLCKGRTVISIAHRIPSVMRADQILVIDQGRVVESGRHAELAAGQGIYHKLVEAYWAEN